MTKEWEVFEDFVRNFVDFSGTYKNHKIVKIIIRLLSPVRIEVRVFIDCLVGADFVQAYEITKLAHDEILTLENTYTTRQETNLLDPTYDYKTEECRFLKKDLPFVAKLFTEYEYFKNLVNKNDMLALLIENWPKRQEWEKEWEEIEAKRHYPSLSASDVGAMGR